MNQKRALIIDDDVEITRLFSNVLELVGYHCDVALTAREALSRLTQSVPTLVLLDMRLGAELGGLDILYQIRSNPRFEKTRVIVITAYPNEVTMVGDLSDLVLIKPVDVQQLQLLATRMHTWTEESKDFSFRDPVTFFFNLEIFETRLELAYQRVQRHPETLFAVVVLQLHPQDENFSRIKLETANSILREAADRLRNTVRPTDTIARLSGWKFALLHEDLKDMSDVDVILERVLAELFRPYQIEEETYFLQVCYGVDLFQHQGVQPDEMLVNAEKALMTALTGGNCAG